ncbi:MAG TPA: hypothetical protein VE442_06625 [Jatrophihabitans sp.]|jgi:hypothetical protein|nr:hypothetical protein [Jatrophihabitans sp.]
MFKQRRIEMDALPILSRGKHRSPKHGACFMEFASYLAGERWTDHPQCTQPLLASLARQVNDHVSDDARQKLVELVPDVIGLTSSDPRADVVIALRAATAALPVVSEERQQVMALAVLNCERLLAHLEGRPSGALSPRSQAALDGSPNAAAWARRHGREGRVSERVFRRQTAPAVVGCAVAGIARACGPDPNVLLRDLLAGAIDDVRPLCEPEAVSASDEARQTPIRAAG